VRGRKASVEAIEAVYRTRFERFASVACAIVGSEAGAHGALRLLLEEAPA
jgi:hypothetical protein